MPRTKQRTPELRDRAVEAPLELLAASGTVGVTARSLAIRADTSPPAVYELFGDKAGVVRALYFEGFRRLSEALSGLRTSAGSVADLWAVAAADPTLCRT